MLCLLVFGLWPLSVSALLFVFLRGKIRISEGGSALLPPDAFESVVCFMPPVGFVQFRQI